MQELHLNRLRLRIAFSLRGHLELNDVPVSVQVQEQARGDQNRLDQDDMVAMAYHCGNVSRNSTCASSTSSTTQTG